PSSPVITAAKLTNSRVNPLRTADTKEISTTTIIMTSSQVTDSSLSAHGTPRDIFRWFYPQPPLAAAGPEVACSSGLFPGSRARIACHTKTGDLPDGRFRAAKIATSPA